MEGARLGAAPAVATSSVAGVRRCSFGLDFDNMVSKDSDSQGVRLSIQSPF